MTERAFSFLPWNERPSKPRKTGVTEIRGPYYTPMGSRYLRDVLETMGDYVDALKFAGGASSCFPERRCRRSGFISVSIDDRLRLVERVQRHGLQPKAEIGIQFGAGGATPTAALEAAGTREVRLLMEEAKRFSPPACQCS